MCARVCLCVLIIRRVCRSVRTCHLHMNMNVYVCMLECLMHMNVEVCVLDECMHTTTRTHMQCLITSAMSVFVG